SRRWSSPSSRCRSSSSPAPPVPPPFPARRSSDLPGHVGQEHGLRRETLGDVGQAQVAGDARHLRAVVVQLPPHRFRQRPPILGRDRKSTRLNSSHVKISYAVFCLKKTSPPYGPGT